MAAPVPADHPMMMEDERRSPATAHAAADGNSGSPPLHTPPALTLVPSTTPSSAASFSSTYSSLSSSSSSSSPATSAWTRASASSPPKRPRAASSDPPGATANPAAPPAATLLPSMHGLGGRSVPALRPAATLTKQAPRARLVRARRAVWSQQDLTLLADVHIAAALVLSAQQRAEGRAGDASSLHPCPYNPGGDVRQPPSKQQSPARTSAASPSLSPSGSPSSSPVHHSRSQSDDHKLLVSNVNSCCSSTCTSTTTTPNSSTCCGHGCSIGCHIHHQHQDMYHMSQPAGHLQPRHNQLAVHAQTLHHQPYHHQPCFRPFRHQHHSRNDASLGAVSSPGTDTSAQDSPPVAASNSVSSQLSTQLVTLSI